MPMSPWAAHFTEFGFIVARRETGLGAFAKQEFDLDSEGNIAKYPSENAAVSRANIMNEELGLRRRNADKWTVY